MSRASSSSLQLPLKLQPESYKPDDAQTLKRVLAHHWSPPFGVRLGTPQFGLFAALPSLGLGHIPICMVLLR
jgi:hypothetical protein